MKKINIQKYLIDSENQIRKKYRALIRGKYLEAEDIFYTLSLLI